MSQFGHSRFIISCLNTEVKNRESKANQIKAFRSNHPHHLKSLMMMSQTYLIIVDKLTLH